MIDKLFEQLPYEFLEKVRFFHLLSASAAIGLLLFVAYFFTLYQDSQTELAKLQTQRTQIAQKLANFKRLVAQKDTIANNLARVTGRLEAFKQQLPREKDMPGLLKEVSGFGSDRATFDVTKFQLENGRVGDFYKEIPVAIQMRGTFWDTLDFLDKMQNRLQLVNFSDLKMKLGTEASFGGNRESALQGYTLITNITVNTYAYIEGSEKVVGVPNNSIQ
ncbi:MAG: type 4a pilus biogenesis protein PilO [Nitrospinae bacterium]|nr:type 4a pilus biogenesis protein PilO [Nitrospinota bacterium]